MYRLNTQEHIILVDVDDTLVSLSPRLGVTPIIQEGIAYYPIQKSIDTIIHQHIRGYFIRVHSKSGFAWAAKVVDLLGLQDYVDSIETKPQSYLDDLKADEWMSHWEVR